MKVVILFLVCVALIEAKKFEADKCTDDNCLIANGCVCSSDESPITPLENTPQFVVISFDEAVTANNYEVYYKPLFEERKNPDGSKIKATFFVPHEYTDYEAVHQLYIAGHEIGSHSITKNSLADYWRNADLETLIQEFDGQKTILSHFANVAIEDIVGVRTPHYEIQGDTTFNAYDASGFLYDSSWPIRSTSLSYPYSLHFKTNNECMVGTCPEESHDKWVSPINNIRNGKVECNALLSCSIQGTTEEVYDWLQEQFDRHYSETRAPFNLILSSAWFASVETGYEALTTFLDDILKKKDVFIVSQNELINWRKNPVPVAEFRSTNPKRKENCKPISCQLNFGETDVRYMKSCVKCPSVYPWLGNPLGED